MTSIVSPRFEFGKYKGQDVVHQGIRIPLQKEAPNLLLKKFSRRAQRIIKCADKGIEFRRMLPSDLVVLRSLWFDPEDESFPSSMDGWIGTVAVHNDEIVGGAIWKFSGANLFLHQLVAGEKGKELQIPTLLIWESVVQFYGLDIHALDIGVSYNPKRYEFFKNFAVETYPIILKAPFYTPVIRLAPFRAFTEGEADNKSEIRENYTFFPRASYALYAALKHIGGDGEVVIVKTHSGDFVSGCVTSAIEGSGSKWRMRGWTDEKKVKAVIAVHEFGVPVYRKQDLEIIDWAVKNKVPVIEDCAWMWRKVFKESQYAVFSLQKMFNVNYGGLLQGVQLSDEKLWEWGVLDTVKRDLFLAGNAWHLGREERISNWNYYHSLVKADGMMPDSYEYEKDMNEGIWLPTIYMQEFETEEIADAIIKRLEEFGIQAGRYWGTNKVYLPIHQYMSLEEVQYMFAVVKGYFNLCHGYKG